MARTRILRIRISTKEFETIKNNAKVRGFSTVSAFLRAFALEHDFWMEKKVQEMYFLTKEILEIVKKEK